MPSITTNLFNERLQLKNSKILDKILQESNDYKESIQLKMAKAEQEEYNKIQSVVNATLKAVGINEALSESARQEVSSGRKIAKVNA